MAKRLGVESLAVSVAEQLRTDIYNRTIAPGERLKTAELSVRFSVSLGVVREALSLLASEGLVLVERNKGFHVVSLSVEALDDLVAVRRINEGAALRLAVERGDTRWESEIIAAHHRMNKLPAYFTGEVNTYNLEWGQAHAEFHTKLIEACGNPVLLDVCARLSHAAEVYRAWGVPRHGESSRDIAAEHEALLQAALARDPDLASSLLVRHLERTKETLTGLGLRRDQDA